MIDFPEFHQKVIDLMNRLKISFSRVYVLISPIKINHTHTGLALVIARRGGQRKMVRISAHRIPLLE